MNKKKKNAVPAKFHFVAQVHGINGFCARLEVTDVELWEGEVDKAMQSPV